MNAKGARSVRPPSIGRLCLRFLRYPLRRLRSLSSVLILMLLGTGFNLLKPWPMKVLVDNALYGHPLSSRLATLLASWAGPLDRDRLLVVSVLAGIVVFLLGWALKALGAYANIVFGQRMVYDLASELFDHVQRLSLRFHSSMPLGDSIKRITGDCGCVATIVKDALLPTVSSALMLASLFGIMMRLDAALTLVSLAAMPLMVFTFRHYSTPLSTRSYEQQLAEGQLYSVVEQTLSAIPVVVAFSGEEHASRRLHASTRGILNATLAATNLQLKFKTLMGLASALGTAGILWLGAQHVLRGTLSVGAVLVFLSYLASLYGPLESLMYTPLTVQGAAGSARRVLEILDQPLEVRDRADAHALASVAGHLRFDDVSYGYRADRLVLRAISFEAKPGQTIGIVGETGAGKSTLMSLLLRFFDPDQGTISLDGHDLRELRLKTLREHIAIVPQDPFLFPMSIGENIAYARPDATAPEIMAAARAANAHDFIERLPNGYETVVGERGATLSGGERQRLSIARALLKDSPILLLDEPTSALDAGTESAVFDAIERLRAGRTTLIVAHRLSTVRRADQILVLADGSIVERGSHDELLERAGHYARLWHSQIS